jgi:hypothetical protein
MYYATGLPGWARPGYGFGPAPVQPQELSELRAQARLLSEQLAGINKRIDEIEKSPPGE